MKCACLGYCNQCHCAFTKFLATFDEMFTWYSWLLVCWSVWSIILSVNCWLQSKFSHQKTTLCQQFVGIPYNSISKHLTHFSQSELDSRYPKTRSCRSLLVIYRTELQNIPVSFSISVSVLCSRSLSELTAHFLENVLQICFASHPFLEEWV